MPYAECCARRSAIAIIGSGEVAGLVSAGSAVTGIGLTATQQGQQPITVSLAGG